MRKRLKDQRTLWSLRCVTCDRLLEETPSGYWACGAGHGGLQLDQEASELPYEGLAMFPDEEVACG